MNLAVLVSGRGSNLGAILEAGLPVRVVISNVPDAPALSIARSASVETVILAPAKDVGGREARDRLLVQELQAREIEFVALAGYNRVFSSCVVEAFPNRIVNIHPSLLPAFPGLAPGPQRDALAAGVKVSGCTVHLVTSDLDAGPIIAQTCVPVLPNDTVESLSDRILAEEHRLFPAVLAGILAGKLRINSNKAWLLD